MRDALGFLHDGIGYGTLRADCIILGRFMILDTFQVQALRRHAHAAAPAGPFQVFERFRARVGEFLSYPTRMKANGFPLESGQGLKPEAQPRFPLNDNI
jgi:hypothetical protein